MADNVLLNPGSGGDTIAADDISGVKHQQVKVEFGADGTATPVSQLYPLPVMDWRLNYAEQVIEDTYGDTVSVLSKLKTLLKFGRNSAVTTSATTLMTLPSGVANETYVSSNAIDRISSADNGDTQQITIEGHTISGSNLTFVTQNVTLTGQTAATLSTPLARATRAYNNGTTNLTGPVYVYENTSISSGVPTDGTKVHLMIAGGKNQSEKASTSMSSSEYWIVTNFYADFLDKTAGYATVELQIRLAGKVFREVAQLSCSAGSRGLLQFDPFIIVPKNADVRLVGITDAAGGKPVSGGIQGYLALVQ